MEGAGSIRRCLADERAGPVRPRPQRRRGAVRSENSGGNAMSSRSARVRRSRSIRATVGLACLGVLALVVSGCSSDEEPGDAPDSGSASAPAGKWSDWMSFDSSSVLGANDESFLLSTSSGAPRSIRVGASSSPNFRRSSTRHSLPVSRSPRGGSSPSSTTTPAPSRHSTGRGRRSGTSIRAPSTSAPPAPTSRSARRSR